jgi:putative pyruvate formate lyase activating enzyme
MDYKKCRLCPHECGVDRTSCAVGICGANQYPRIARAALHHWEEPCISGRNGSGTVFFSFCNLGCVFCQNYQVSHGQFGKEISRERLTEIFLDLQNKGAHNLNLVTATHFLPDIIPALIKAKEKGFVLPVIYNSGGYESLETLDILSEAVDVFLPDLKFASAATGKELANTPDYFQRATLAIKKMARLAGTCTFDKDGLITRGLIVRHLVLPGKTGESRTILKWIKEELPEWVMVSLMGQYLPAGDASNHSQLGRRLKQSEYDSVVEYLYDLDLENGYVQELAAASSEYIPIFDLTGV